MQRNWTNDRTDYRVSARNNLMYERVGLWVLNLRTCNKFNTLWGLELWDDHWRINFTFSEVISPGTLWDFRLRFTILQLLNLVNVTYSWNTYTYLYIQMCVNWLIFYSHLFTNYSACVTLPIQPRNPQMHKHKLIIEFYLDTTEKRPHHRPFHEQF